MRFAVVLAVAFLLNAGCKKDDEQAKPQAPKPADREADNRTSDNPAAADKPASGKVTPAVIAHGGVGSPPSRSDGCRRAVDAALAVLERGGDPHDAAVAGVMIMEDDERFNAGIGSRVRIDGKTVQMDASIMNSDGKFGAVAVIEHVRNPIKVARAVLDIPHILLAGDGTTRFARTLGLDYYDPATERMKQATAEIINKLRAADPSLPSSWQEFDWRARWNFETSLEKAGLTQEELGSDTVGVAVRAADGTFVVALSTGGTAITLRGRVGDVPILGAGLYAGSHGAVAATGSGERIVEATLSRRVHDWMAAGTAPQAAAKRGVDEVKGKGSIGLIVITATNMTAAADRDMAWAGRELGSDTWFGPDPSK